MKQMSDLSRRYRRIRRFREWIKREEKELDMCYPNLRRITHPRTCSYVTGEYTTCNEPATYQLGNFSYVERHGKWEWMTTIVSCALHAGKEAEDGGGGFDEVGLYQVVDGEWVRQREGEDDE